MVTANRPGAGAADIEERLEPDGIGTPTELRQADAGDHSVLAGQRHDIGERAQRRDLHERAQPALPPGPLTQRLDELEGDARPGQVLFRVPAVPPLGVEHGQGPRQLVVRLVVVGDDEVDAKLARAIRGLGRPDATIDRHDDASPIGMEPVDGRRLQPVAVANPVGQEMRHVGPQQLEGATHHDGRGDAVHVVVSVDGDSLPSLDRSEQAVHRLAHPCQSPRIVQMLEARPEESERGVRCLVAALEQQAPDDGGDVQICGETVRPFGVTRQMVPDQWWHA